MARVSPAAFSRQDGKLKAITYFGKPVGGTYALLAGDDVYTGTEEMVGYRAESHDRFASFAGRKLVVTENTAYVANGTQLSALDRKAFPAASSKLQSLRARKVALDRQLRSGKTPELEAQAAALAAALQKAQEEFAAATLWKIPCPCEDSLILAGDVVFAGGDGQVVALGADSGDTLWTGHVEGTAKGLAAASGRLLVSTDKGPIYCFGPQGTPQTGTVTEPINPNPYADSPLGDMFQQAAETILRTTGVKRGYCLVLGLETGQLALELAKGSELTVYAVDPDAKKVAAAGAAIDAAGLAGARVCVDKWPLDKLPYADYFANLVVSETTMVTGTLPPATDEIARVLKPLGGTLFLGQPADRAKSAEPLDADALRRWLEASKLEGAGILVEDGTWAKSARGPLPGAGSWTHLYANPANTACGDDRRVKCPLGVLWFGRPGPGRMVNRHSRAASPLSIDGRLFIQGENVIMAYDAYNGLNLWEREIPGAMRTNASHDGSNLALNPEGLFVAVGEKCLRLDPATGQTVITYNLPTEPDGTSGRWGYIACDDGLLYGGRTSGNLLRDRLFALDIQTGKPRWIHQGEKIPHATISIGDGQILFVDAGVTAEERQQAIDQQRARIRQLPEPDRAAAEKALANPDVRRVVALDAQTGEPRWQQPVDLTHCGGGALAAMVNDGVMAIFGVYLDGHYWRQFFAGEFAARRVTALSAEDGKFLWSQPVGYRVRPLIIGSTLHAEPWAFDLHTGTPKTRVHPVTGEADRWQFARPGHHCGGPAASPNCLFFRSYCLGYYDLIRDAGTMHFGAQRPGCWINFIPAGGLLLLPEASAGCMCPFPNMCSIAFKPTTQDKAYTYYSAPGPMTPVRRLAINFGAAGDRSDAAGNLWLGYPRPGGSLVLQFKVDVAFHAGGSFTARNSAYTPVAGTPDPWLFTSAARGLRKCALPLLEKADGTALYRVRLAWADPDNDQLGQRVFDVKLQGQTVLEGLDVVKETGGRDRALVKEFSGIEVSDKLLIELVPKAAGTGPGQTPILQGVEVIRERIVSLGCAAPDFLLSSLGPKQAGELLLTNLRDEAFSGKIETAVPEGFQVSLKQTEINLASGAHAAIPVEATVAAGVPAGDYAVSMKLVRPDGTVELERTIGIEHLGRRGRVVLNPVEDTCAGQRYPDQNKGTATVLLVDGGSAKMGDTDHHVSYLKFHLDVPGKPLGVRLRIHNAGNPTGNSGRICLVTGPWSENSLSYATRPELGPELAQLGPVSENQVIERVLEVDLSGKKELSLAIDPTSCDGVDYLSRESGKPAELIIEYEPAE